MYKSIRFLMYLVFIDYDVVFSLNACVRLSIRVRVIRPSSSRGTDHSQRRIQTIGALGQLNSYASLLPHAWVT